MRVILAILGCVLLIGLIALTPFLLDLKPVQDAARAKVFKRDLAEGVRIGKKGLYGIDVIRCGRCRLEKRRRGPLTFGGLNVLVLENLRVVVPGDSDVKAWGENDAPSDVEENSPKQTLAAIGLSDSFLKTQGVVPRFSGVRLEGLEVCRLEGTNIVTTFMAAHGKVIREGLKLQRCRVRTPGGFEFVEDALLQVKPRLRLSWNGGAMDL